jgi:hypothetical protein
MHLVTLKAGARHDLSSTNQPQDITERMRGLFNEMNCIFSVLLSQSLGNK